MLGLLLRAGAAHAAVDGPMGIPRNVQTWRIHLPTVWAIIMIFMCERIPLRRPDSRVLAAIASSEVR